MLHLAMVRSPSRTRDHQRDAEPASRARRRRRAHRRGPGRGARQPAHGWTVTPDQKTPPAPVVAVDHVAFAGEIVAVSSPGRRRGRATPPSSSTSTTTSSPPARPEGRGRRTRCSRIRISGRTSPRSGVRLGRGRHRRHVEEAIEEARANGIVIEREYRQQRLIPAFMEPRSFVSTHRRELAMWSSTQCRTSSGSSSRGARDPGAQDPGDRARRRRRLRRQAPVHRRRSIT